MDKLKFWKPKNWQSMTDVQAVGKKWANKNCGDDVLEYLVFEPDGIYTKLPTDKEITNLSGKYVIQDK